MSNSINQINIHTGTRILNIKANNLSRNYPAAVGKPATPTPTGNYSVVNKIINPGGMLGTRWLGLNIPGGVYGIHGTNNPDSIGKAVSNGCIRMQNQDIEEIFPYIAIGTRVTINDYYTNPTEVSNGKSLTEYIVKQGDSLWLIAQKNNILLDKLIIANPHINPDHIFPGQTVIIP
ncbi:ErfK/YbiS/YcfS/YnhG family protein [Desulfofarcimen acetoxidans DSM 771]|jgi:hypothetical protein|uniref:ErfK/YbiS/YcfS/YnhG family protein n=1 Tax=Desulfofarcimen acetoxidans (strain ATCC 49208 / DSM 771 / KCTC 5769 / VKM B-1644 / 5575) TaxID=485916 RepID=C8W2Z7_DESAS|nr:L,D-transpeptidase family protein [Desulfofarcimen acetoxidans]ACV61153.1 ErfK/YbiS/YcfS/YnhG family protein [Desulfofarcimen acetoxidans DSM 771]